MSLADEHTASFRAQTGKRKGSAFLEDGTWWVIDADGHQWGLGEAGWIRYTDEFDEYVCEVARAKRKRVA